MHILKFRSYGGSHSYKEITVRFPRVSTVQSMEVPPAIQSKEKMEFLKFLTKHIFEKNYIGVKFFYKYLSRYISWLKNLFITNALLKIYPLTATCWQCARWTLLGPLILCRPCSPVADSPERARQVKGINLRELLRALQHHSASSKTTNKTAQENGKKSVNKQTCLRGEF